jgi:hypothetical protein
MCLWSHSWYWIVVPNRIPKSRPAMVPTQPPIQWVPGVRREGYEGDHSPPSSADVKGCVELYFHSPPPPHASSWRSAWLSTGTTLPLPSTSPFKLRYSVAGLRQKLLCTACRKGRMRTFLGFFCVVARRQGYSEHCWISLLWWLILNASLVTKVNSRVGHWFFADTCFPTAGTDSGASAKTLYICLRT